MNKRIVINYTLDMTCIITTKICNQDFQRANRSSPTIIAFYKN